MAFSSRRRTRSCSRVAIRVIRAPAVRICGRRFRKSRCSRSSTTIPTRPGRSRYDREPWFFKRERGSPMKFRKLSVGLLLVVGVAGTIFAPNVFSQKLACDAGNGGITLPAGFCAIVAADNLGTARHLVVAANGDVYVALQKPGGGVALRDANGDGKFEVKE